MNRGLVAIIIVVLVAGFVALNLLSGMLVRGGMGARWDATEGSLFTLTQGSREIAKSSQEPINLTFFYSARLVQGRPSVQIYAQRVRELLEEFARVSGGKIRLTIVDPEPFSEAEDAAVAAGITGVPLGEGESLYFGLLGTNAIDGREIIAFFNPAKERFLEYDVARLIESLANLTKPILGLITTLPMEGGFAMDPRSGQPTQTPPWRLIQELRQLYDVRTLARPTLIPPEIKVLVVVHPRELPPATLYAIDQFVMRGGGLIAMVDPAAEAQQVPPAAPVSAMQPPPDRASSLGPLMGAWGVEIPEGQLVGDAEMGLRVTTPGDLRGESVPYVLWMVARAKQMSREDPVMADLEIINLASVGQIRAAGSGEGPRVTITPLIQTTKGAGILRLDALTPPIEPRRILKSFTPGTEALTIAARLSGNVRSAYPDGAPPVDEENQPESQPENQAENKDEAAAELPAHLKESVGPINVVLVADSDLLQDMFWSREENLFGQRITRRLADNADFVMALIDNLAGGRALAGVRSRREIARPFTVVDEMAARAEREFLTQQEMLEERLKQTQQRIDELQATRGNSEDALALTPEQQAEVDRFRVEVLETRRELRGVRLSLRRDIETLGTQLKVVNIALIPAVICVVAVAMWIVKVLRRRAARA